MASQPEPKPRKRLAPVAAAAAVAVAATAVVVVLWAWPSEEELAAADVQEMFLEAWERHRHGTYVMEAEWSRQARDSDREMRSATLHVQDPPDRVIRQFGSARGQLGGREVRCDTDIEDSYRCINSSHPVGDYEQGVAEELEILASYFDEPMPLYSVEISREGCFVLTQVGPWPDPPYGTEAEMCFDEQTGALRYIRRELQNMVEVTEAVSITPEVLPTDFDLGRDDRFDPEGDLGEAPEPEE